MDLSKIENVLISELKLSEIQAKVFLLLVTEGKSSSDLIAKKLNISSEIAGKTAMDLVELGGIIEISNNIFDSMHPRFTAVNMYRKMCMRKNIEFKRNKIVDNIGVVLEQPYEDARTK